MKLQQVWFLCRQNIKRSRKTFLLSASGITLGIAVMTFFIALSLGIQKRVIAQIFPPGRLEVIPKKDSGNTLSDLLSSRSEPNPTDETVKQLARHPDVENVFPRMRAEFPMNGWGSFLGRPLYLDLVVEGLDPAAVKDLETRPLPFADLDQPEEKACKQDQDCRADHECNQTVHRCKVKFCPYPQDPKSCRDPAYCAWDINYCKMPIPVMVSPIIIELYNNLLAKSRNLPKIGDFTVSALRGFRFTAQLLGSFIPGVESKNKIQRHMQFVGVSDRAVPIGLSVPLPYVKRWNSKYASERIGKVYSSLSVDIKPNGNVTAVSAEIRRLGFELEKNGEDKVGLAVTLMTALFVVISLGIIFMAIVNIAHVFLRALSERKREFGVMRAVGASARDLQLLLLSEAMLMGVTGGGVGLLSSWFISLFIDFLARHVLPDFPFKPTSFFYFSPSLCISAFVLSIVACILGAYFPSRVATRLAPAEVLSGS